MKPTIQIRTLDTHTAGMPTRILPEGDRWTADTIDSIQGAKDSFRTDHDHIRQLLMQEPRGHDSMYGAVLLPPFRPSADLGVFFIDATGYVDACIHGSIGVITALIETGELDYADEVSLDTPAGLLKCRPRRSDESVESVEVTNVPSFFVDRIEVEVGPRREPVVAQLVYAGNLFALVDVDDLEISLGRSAVHTIVELGERIQNKANEQLSSGNREIPGGEVDHVEFYDTSSTPPTNVTVINGSTIDRSPCGTGTCAMMALKSARGELEVGEKFEHASRIGTTFTGRILEVEDRSGSPTVVPAVRGSAHMTGFHTFYRSASDPLDGFSID